MLVMLKKKNNSEVVYNENYLTAEKKFSLKKSLKYF